MTPRIGPYSPLAAILAKAVVDTDRPGVQLRWARDLGQSPRSGVSFPHPLTVSPPDSVADGTPNGTQKTLTLPVRRPSVFSGDWPGPGKAHRTRPNVADPPPRACRWNWNDQLRTPDDCSGISCRKWYARPYAHFLTVRIGRPSVFGGDWRRSR